MTPIIAKAIAKKPDMIVAGTQSQDAYGQVKALVQAGYNPKFLFFANGANSPTEFPSKVGAKNVNGIFSCSDWTPAAPTNGNKLFVQQYIKKYGGDQFGIDNNSSEAWAVGQLLQLVAKKTGSIDNQKIITALHSGTWPTIEGNLSWNAYGEPSGQDLLVEWVNGKLLPVFPAKVALAKPFSPKPAWGG
jgi:branched-chain amino acid transport system substrate-binding protein